MKTTFKKTLATLTISTVIIGSSATLALGVNNTTKAQTNAPAQNTQQNGGFGQGFRRGGGMQFDVKPVLDKLVKAKTITAAQEKKIIAYQTAQTAKRQAEMDKLSKMTQDQRQKYFASQNNGNNGNGGQGGFQRQSQYADLVKNKTITQKQADAITAAVRAARPNFGNRMNGQNGQNNQNN
jgi:hypothetical protein